VQGPSEVLVPFAVVAEEPLPVALVGEKLQHAAAADAADAADAAAADAVDAAAADAVDAVDAAADELLMSCMLWEQHHNFAGVLLVLDLLASHRHGPGGGLPGR